MVNGHQELIRLEQVEKRYGRYRVLKVESLSLQENDRVLVSGANGSGKSTLLKVLGGITPVDRGRVWRAKALRGAALSYVPQSGGLYGQLSVRDNLLLRRRLYGRGNASLDEAWYIHELGLIPMLPKRFAELSGGFQRLATLAAALYVEPTWLLLDEPFDGVDFRNVRSSWNDGARSTENYVFLWWPFQPPRNFLKSTNGCAWRKGTSMFAALRIFYKDLECCDLPC